MEHKIGLGQQTRKNIPEKKINYTKISKIKNNN